MDKRPIGIFDSGVGGLTVVGRIKKILPGERIIYFGDTARVPYGTKSKETVTRFSKENVRFLLKFKAKLIVVACNTASSLTLPALRRAFDVPIVGVIKPGVYRALELSKGGTVGVIGTRATISSGTYKRLLKKERPSLRVISSPCPLFVPLVEEGWLDNYITSAVAENYLEKFKRERVETVILGCTHYPLLKPVIKKIMGKGVRLVDSAEETARAVRSVLKERGLLSSGKATSSHRYFVTDEPSIFKKVGERFLGSRIESITRVRQ